MNEISVQQMLNTKASAPARESGKSGTVSADGKAPTVVQAEDRQTEQMNLSAQQLEQKEKAMEEQVEQAVAQLNDYVQNTERKLEFQVDDDSGETVVRVYDKSSEELIRQIPNEEALELAKRLNQEEPLMLFSAQV
jgi:flagellar protein FlaG